jgi:hypothetical protein
MSRMGSSLCPCIAATVALSCSGASEKAPDHTPTPTGRDESVFLLDRMAKTPAKPRRDVRPQAGRDPTIGQPAGPRKSLSKEELQAGMRLTKDAVQACYDRYRLAGAFAVKVTVASSGQPSEVFPSAIDLQSSTPSRQRLMQCIGEAVSRRAHFPAFQGPPITFSYPFILR